MFDRFYISGENCSHQSLKLQISEDARRQNNILAMTYSQIKKT